jgi:hypothetical protein
LIIEGSASTGLHFYHADGRLYGELPPDGRAIDVAAKAFAALRGLGFEESSAKRALAEARSQVGEGGEFEALIRGALAVLTPRPRSRPSACGARR